MSCFDITADCCDWLLSELMNRFSCMINNFIDPSVVCLAGLRSAQICVNVTTTESSFPQFTAPFNLHHTAQFTGDEAAQLL